MAKVLKGQQDLIDFAEVRHQERAEAFDVVVDAAEALALSVRSGKPVEEIAAFALFALQAITDYRVQSGEDTGGREWTVEEILQREG